MTENGHRVDRVVTEVGSALNANRAKFKRLLSDPSAATIIVERRDRLARFGAKARAAAAMRGGGAENAQV